MAILIGVDEAGYGPNYGPLAIAATAWRVQKTPRAGGFIPPVFDLYKLLKKSITRSPQECPKRIAIADSKQLYKPGQGLRQLERGVLAALLATSPNQTNCIDKASALLAATLADPDNRRHQLACHAGDAMTLPHDATTEEISELAALLRATCEASGVTLLAVRARLIYPAEFNELVDHHGTKGAALSHVTLALVREVVDASMKPGGTSPPARLRPDSRLLTPDSSPTAHCPLPTAPCSITLDKHGGRNRYGAILQHHFPDSWIETLDEGRSASRYRWTHNDAPIEATFRVGGEELLPAALASMTAKYHRELAMHAFNAYWTAKLPGLKPTAGYPNDAKRFRAEISQMQRELQIDDRLIWRNR